MHASAYSNGAEGLPDFGLYRFRKGAELHANSPEFIRRLHAHTRKPHPEHYSAVEELGKAAGPTFLRDLLEMLPEQPVSLEDVESLESILKRFSTQAMSLGSLSPAPHQTFTLSINPIGGPANTRESRADSGLLATPG